MAYNMVILTHVVNDVCKANVYAVTVNADKNVKWEYELEMQPFQL